MARMASPSTSDPSPAIARHRSASPSCAMPRSAWFSSTAARSTSRWVEPTPALMLGLSGPRVGSARLQVVEVGIDGVGRRPDPPYTRPGGQCPRHVHPGLDGVLDGVL